MTSPETRNTYLDQVVAQQQVLEANLRSKRAVSPPPPAAAAPALEAEGFAREAPGRAFQQPPPVVDNKANAVEVRVTGFGRWKTVLVPPNAFVVHTRRGRAEPVHIGLGVSFRYNSIVDSYLV